MAISAPTMTAKTLEARVALLEKAVQSSGQSLVFQVGSSKIEITASGITLHASGDITIRSTNQINLNAGTNLMVQAGRNMNLQSSSDTIVKAFGQMQLTANSKVTVRGSTVDIN